MIRVAVVGDIVLDVLVRPTGPLAHGSDVRGSVEFSPGGSAANFAVWAARSGAGVSLLGALGTDSIGDLLLADLVSAGVRTSGIARLAGRSPSLCALIDPDGERTMVTDRQATLAFGPEHVAVAALTGAQHLHLTAYSLFDPRPSAAAMKAVEVARGASVSLDLSSSALILAHGVRRTWDEIAALRPDVLFGNEMECLALSGCAGAEEAALALNELAPMVVVKRGGRGCLLAVRGDAPETFPATKAEALDATGAGDAFDAAWVCAWLRRESPAQACVAGNELAGRVVQMSGARGSRRSD